MLLKDSLHGALGQRGGCCVQPSPFDATLMGAVVAACSQASLAPMMGRVSALYITLLCLRGGHPRTSTTRQRWPWSSATLQTVGKLTSEPSQLLLSASACCLYTWAHALDRYAAMSGLYLESACPSGRSAQAAPAWRLCTPHSPPAPGTLSTA